MNKTELIAAVAKKAEMSKASAAKAFNALLEVTKEEMKKKDGKIAIIGFGTFYMQQRAKRNGKNPRTGKKIVIPAKKVFKFKASKKF
ncbi:MAG: HU family DNA-binding protein [Bacteroidales bacterium]|nr:HU family DNA-binding protein [Bacteroidales bacterium]